MQQSHQDDISPYDDPGRLNPLLLFVGGVEHVLGAGLRASDGAVAAGSVMLLLRLRHRGGGLLMLLNGEKTKEMHDKRQALGGYRC